MIIMLTTMTTKMVTMTMTVTWRWRWWLLMMLIIIIFTIRQIHKSVKLYFHTFSVNSALPSYQRQSGCMPMGWLKTREWKTRHQVAGVENAGVENAAPSSGAYSGFEVRWCEAKKSAGSGSKAPAGSLGDGPRKLKLKQEFLPAH